MTNSQSLRAMNYGLHTGGLSIAAVIGWAMYSFVFGPMQEQQLAINRQITNEKQLVSQAVSIRVNHREAEQQLEHSEATFARVISRIPETPHESEFLAQVTQLARDSDLRIQRYHPREPVNEGTHTALEVQLDSIADYSGTCRFLDGLRTLARLCRVTKLHLQPIGADGNDLAIEMTLRIYFAPLSKTDDAEQPHG